MRSDKILCLVISSCCVGSGYVVAQESSTRTLIGPPNPSESEERKCDPAELKRGAEVFWERVEATDGLAFDGLRNAPDDLLTIMLDSHKVLIAKQRGSAHSAQPETIEVEIDAATQSVDFILNHSTCDVLQFFMARPDGVKVRQDDEDAKFGGANGLRRIRVNNPVAGTWKAFVEGEGRFQFRANGKSSIAFHEIRFERLVEGYMHPFGQDLGTELL
jgi:hypothetical protein